MFSALQSESPTTVSCTVRNCVLGCFARCETGFARCERLFWDSRPRETKSLLALSLKHFWAFWLFYHLYQASRVAMLGWYLGLRCWSPEKVSRTGARPVRTGATLFRTSARDFFCSSAESLKAILSRGDKRAPFERALCSSWHLSEKARRQ